MSDSTAKEPMPFPRFRPELLKVPGPWNQDDGEGDGDLCFPALVEERRERIGREEGQWKTHVKLLLKLLHHRGIELTKEDMVALARLKFTDLPDITVAFDATDVEDFVTRAGLHQHRSE